MYIEQAEQIEHTEQAELTERTEIRIAGKPICWPRFLLYVILTRDFMRRHAQYITHK